ncbi:unnamed protein product [Amoebophrya sp. A120]|nr:unnamed protein product [Amoebophrya sp. A120]|eukprot:GSA120T00014265001.1
MSLPNNPFAPIRFHPNHLFRRLSQDTFSSGDSPENRMNDLGENKVDLPSEDEIFGNCNSGATGTGGGPASSSTATASREGRGSSHLLDTNNNSAARRGSSDFSKDKSTPNMIKLPQQEQQPKVLVSGLLGGMLQAQQQEEEQQQQHRGQTNERKPAGGGGDQWRGSDVVPERATTSTGSTLSSSHRSSDQQQQEEDGFTFERTSSAESQGFGPQSRHDHPVKNATRATSDAAISGQGAVADESNTTLLGSMDSTMAPGSTSSTASSSRTSGQYANSNVSNQPSSSNPFAVAATGAANSYSNVGGPEPPARPSTGGSKIALDSVSKQGRTTYFAPVSSSSSTTRPAYQAEMSMSPRFGSVDEDEEEDIDMVKISAPAPVIVPMSIAPAPVVTATTTSSSRGTSNTNPFNAPDRTSTGASSSATARERNRGAQPRGEGEAFFPVPQSGNSAKEGESVEPPARPAESQSAQNNQQHVPETSSTATVPRQSPPPPVTSNQPIGRKKAPRALNQFDFMRKAEMDMQTRPANWRQEKNKILIPFSEVQKHNKRSDAWMVLGGHVYDVTSYMAYHPGGKGELLRGIGKDATDIYNQAHSWVAYDTILKSEFLGKVTYNAFDNAMSPSGSSPAGPGRMSNASNSLSGPISLTGDSMGGPSPPLPGRGSNLLRPPGAGPPGTSGKRLLLPPK